MASTPDDCADAVLLSTRASSTHYDRTFMETFVRPGPGAANWVSRTNYPLTGIHPANGAQLMFFVSQTESHRRLWRRAMGMADPEDAVQQQLLWCE